MQRRLVIKSGIVQQVQQATTGTRFGVARTKVHFRYAGQNNGPCTHGAGFQGYVHPRVFQPPTPQTRSGRRNGNHFRMGGRILKGLPLIVGLGNNLPVVNYDAANGNFPLLHGQFRFPEGIIHISFVRIKHSQVLSVSATVIVNRNLGPVHRDTNRPHGGPPYSRVARSPGDPTQGAG